MAGDKGTETQQATTKPAESSSLWNHSWVDKFKHGAKSLGDKATELGHKGLEEGKRIAAHPTTKKVEAEVIGAGKQVGQEHLRQVHGTIEAGKAGDIQGVIRNGLPLAAEAALGPQAIALKIAKDEAAKQVLEHVPANQRPALKHGKDAVDKIAHPSLPNLIIDGVSTKDHGESKR